jgi:hypothetical protein
MSSTGLIAVNLLLTCGGQIPLIGINEAIPALAIDTRGTGDAAFSASSEALVEKGRGKVGLRGGAKIQLGRGQGAVETVGLGHRGRRGHGVREGIEGLGASAVHQLICEWVVGIERVAQEHG